MFVACPKCCTATGPDELWNLTMTVGWHLAPSAFSRLGYEECAFEPDVVPSAPTGGDMDNPSATYPCPTRPQGQFVVLQILRPGQPTYLATCEIAVFGEFLGGGFNNVQCTSRSSICSSAARRANKIFFSWLICHAEKADHGLSPVFVKRLKLDNTSGSCVYVVTIPGCTWPNKLFQSQG